MNVPLFDLSLQHQQLEVQLNEAFQNVLRHGKWILGPEVELLEKEIAQLCRAKHAIACASGSDALLLALLALDIGPGDEVITSPYSFFATASCIARVGARAVFADISLCCYNLNPEEVVRKISPRTKAIIPVHLYGQSAEMRSYLDVARQKGIAVIEDAAQAIGAEYEGKPVGSLGDIGCFSFYPTKNLGGFGDGGMLITQNDRIAEKLRVLRVHGAQPKYVHQVLGVNSRLDTLQAALLRVKVPHLESWAEARRKNADLYTKLLVEAKLAALPAKSKSSSDGSFPLILPGTCQPKQVHNQYVVRTSHLKARDPLRKHLSDSGIGTEIYYPIPLHLQKCFSLWNYASGQFPNSEHAALTSLALPIFPELTSSQIEAVVHALASFPWKDYK